MARTDRSGPGCRLDRSGDGRYALAGDLGFESAGAVLADGEAAFAREHEVTVDLSGVTDADSAGLAVLIEWTRAARSSGRRIRFLGMPARLGDIARISGVSDLLPIAG